MSDQDWIHVDHFETGGQDSQKMVSLWRESKPDEKVELPQADYEATKARVGTADHGKLWSALRAARPTNAVVTQRQTEERNPQGEKTGPDA